MKKLITALLIIPLLILIPGCSKKTEVLKGEVTFISGSLKINNQNAAVGNIVSENDILVTDKNSLAVIQISQTAVVTLKSDTELKFEKLLNNKDAHTVSMMLEKGSTFHNVLKKGTEYSVKAPTAVASVRGTSFEVKADEKATTIDVETGTVYVMIVPGTARADKNLTESQNNGSEEIVLTAGQSLEVTSNRAVMTHGYSIPGSEKISNTVTAYTPAGSDRVKTGNNRDSAIEKKQKPELTYKNSVKTAKSEEKVVNTSIKAEKKSAEEKKYTPPPATVNALINNRERKLEDIREVYKRLDMISLYSGAVITGAIIERGDLYSILTPDGILKISKKDIQSDEIIR